MTAQPNPYKRNEAEQKASAGSASAVCKAILAALLVIAVAAAVFFGVQYSRAKGQLTDVMAKQEETAEELLASERELASAKAELEAVKSLLAETQEQLIQTQSALDAAAQQNLSAQEDAPAAE